MTDVETLAYLRRPDGKLDQVGQRFDRMDQRQDADRTEVGSSDEPGK